MLLYSCVLSDMHSQLILCLLNVFLWFCGLIYTYMHSMQKLFALLVLVKDAGTFCLATDVDCLCA